MSAEQLYSLLKNIPSSRIEKAEVMYNAPARYQVQGCAHQYHTETKHPEARLPRQGELYGKYNQKHYEGFNERASLIYNGNKFSADFLYSHNHGRGYSLTDKEAMHSLADGSVHHITTDEMGRSRSHTHSFRGRNGL